MQRNTIKSNPNPKKIKNKNLLGFNPLESNPMRIQIQLELNVK